MICAITALRCEQGDLLNGVVVPEPESEPEPQPEQEPTLAQKLRGIWIIGGTSTIAGSTMVNEIDLYDPVTDKWYPDVAKNANGSYSPTAFPQVGSLNGKIYVCGGAISNTTVASTVFEYDVANNSWSTLTSMPQNIMDGVCYVQGDYLYVIGGTNTVTTAGVQTTHYKFDPSSGTGSWSTMTAYTTARSSMAGWNFNGMVSFMGGRITGGGPQTTNDMYVINTNNYTGGTETAIIVSGRGGMAYAGYADEHGTYVFLVGGASAFTAATAYFSLTAITFVTQASSFLVYTPPATTNGWFYGTYHPAFTGGTTTGIVFASAVVSPYNGSSETSPTLYIFGGIKHSPPVTVTDEVYAIKANGTTVGTNYSDSGWVAKTSMPRARYGHRSVTINQ
jgi:hypothetical protein